MRPTVLDLVDLNTKNSTRNHAHLGYVAQNEPALTYAKLKIPWDPASTLHRYKNPLISHSWPVSVVVGYAISHSKVYSLLYIVSRREFVWA